MFRREFVRVIVTTTAALVAFASNSILCRVALSGGAIDAASFTLVRVWSGAIVLFFLSTILGARNAYRAGSWSSAVALVAYAVTFSFAYVNLSAGIGALLLFGAVQITIILIAVHRGERAILPEWAGLASALTGVFYLVAPGLTAPPLFGSALMIVAGVAWGVYTIRGRGATDPLRTTTGNFARSVPLVGAAVIATTLTTHMHVAISAIGIAWALASGGIASALGYVVWYAALRQLSGIRAATVQLSVPVLTAAAGVAFLGERITLHLIVAATLILGGIALAVSSRRRILLGLDASAKLH